MGYDVSLAACVRVALVVGFLAAGAPIAGQSQIDTGGLGWTQGREDAPIQVVEFTDPSCPYCARFHEEARDSLFRNFVDAGHARWVTVPWVSGLYPNSEAVGRVLACVARPEQAEELLTLVYRSRESWLRAGRAEVLGIALQAGEQVGLESEALRDCAESSRAERAVARARVLGRSLGVRGTPTYFVNGFPAMGAVPYGFIRRVFDLELERVSRPGTR
jgi:protein-disulfide isomerase